MSKGGQLILSAVALVAGLFLLVPWATQTLGPTRGYVLVAGLYWFGFCLPLGLYFTRGQRRQLLSLRTGGRRWVPWSVFGLAAILALAVVLRPPETMSLTVLALALVAGAINGPLEELYWRGAWLAQFGKRLPLYLLGLGLFVAWHVPLGLAHGISYQGGMAALVGGAAAMGIFWAWLAWKTGAIGWAMLSHALTNMVVFNELVARNFV